MAQPINLALKLSVVMEILRRIIENAWDNRALLTETETITEIVEVEKIVTETVTETETITQNVNVYVLPEEYSFTRGGVSTVYYTGQTARVGMATELKSSMNDTSFTEDKIDTMFASGTGFSDATLDASGKNVRGKTILT